MLVKVQLNNGYVINMEVGPQDRVRDIKQRIQEQHGIDQTQQRLLHMASILSDEKTVEQLNLRAGATIQLVINLRGGCV